MPFLRDNTQLTFFEQFPESPQSYHSPVSSTAPESLPLNDRQIELKDLPQCYTALTENLTKDKLSHHVVKGAKPSTNEAPAFLADDNEQPHVRSLSKSLLQRALTKCTVPTSFFPRRTLSTRDPRPSLHIETVMSGAQRATDASITQSAPIKYSRGRGISVLGKTPESNEKVLRDQTTTMLCSPSTVYKDGFTTARNRSNSAARPGLESQLERWRSVQRTKVSI